MPTANGDNSGGTGLDLTRLRSEVSDVKKCFTDFSFQALALSLTVLAATFGLNWSSGFAAYAPLAVIPLLMATARLGVFKYSTVNRNLGYELHLARVRVFECDPDPIASSRGWHRSMRYIDWEEALRAWRIVQPTVFREIYVTHQTSRFARLLQAVPLGWTGIPLLKSVNLGILNFFRPDLYRLTRRARSVVERFRAGGNPHIDLKQGKAEAEYPWFMPAVLAEGKGGDRSSAYYAGSYLHGMLSALTAVQALMLLPLALSALGGTSQHFPADMAVLVVVAAAIVARAARMGRRREILEDEFLSIHSCAIMWQAVVTCHYLALEKANGLEHYTEKLAEQAEQLGRSSFSVHKWMNEAQFCERIERSAGTGARIEWQ